MGLPSHAWRSFRARTVRVISATRIEAEISLDFGVRLQKVVKIEGFNFDDRDEELRNAAKHCLVVLLGGKRLVVRPDPRLRERWHALTPLPAVVYRAERVHGEPVGFARALPDVEGPVLDVGAYMSWLAESAFDLDRVKIAVNGKA